LATLNETPNNATIHTSEPGASRQSDPVVGKCRVWRETGDEGRSIEKMNG
jgi:hypothetical protein